jgi:hypothetical protein
VSNHTVNPQVILPHMYNNLIKIMKINKMNMKIKMKTMIKFKRREMIKGDEDESNSRPTPPHPRVHHTVQRDHPVNNILGDIKKGITTRSRVASFFEHYSFVSSFEPFKVEDALRDSDWVVAMQEELNNFKGNEVWSLVERPKQNVVGTKWVFLNKQDEYGVVTRNKA